MTDTEDQALQIHDFLGLSHCSFQEDSREWVTKEHNSNVKNRCGKEPVTGRLGRTKYDLGRMQSCIKLLGFRDPLAA